MKIVSLSADWHVLALDDDGTVWAWGDNWYGELAQGSFKDMPGVGKVGNPQSIAEPSKVPVSNVTAVSAGCGTSLVLKDDGTVWAWGNGEYGQLGYGGTDSQITPVQVKDLSNVTAIAAGITCFALKDDGTVWAWGHNEQGGVGDGTTEPRLTPVRVKELDNITALGEHGTYAIKADGTVWAWGNNIITNDCEGNFIYGALGNGSKTATIPTPFQVENVSDVKQIYAPYPTIYLKNDGTVWGWGGNLFGALGDTMTINSHETVFMPSVRVKIDGVKELSSNNMQTIALKNDGTVWVWGRYIDGICHDNKQGSSTPAQVHGLDHVSHVYSGGMYNLVLKEDGSVWGWGTAQSGELRGYGQKVPDDFNKHYSIVSSPMLIWKGPAEAASENSGTKLLPAVNNTPAPTPGFDFNIAVLTIGLIVIVNLLIHSKRD